MDLVPMVTSAQRFAWDETPWEWEKGFGKQDKPEFNVVAIDYGIKRNILRLLAGEGCKVTVVPAKTSAEDILAMKPDGVFLSNGPGDPAATGEYAVPVIKKVIDSGTPTFGICLGHQMLGLALGGKTMKMHQGHHGANHPVKDMTTGKVEITSMNHGFAVDKTTLPKNVDADARLAVRRFQLRHRAGRQAGVLGAVPSRSVPGPAQLALSLQAVRGSDARARSGLKLAIVIRARAKRASPESHTAGAGITASGPSQQGRMDSGASRHRRNTLGMRVENSRSTTSPRSTRPSRIPLPAGETRRRRFRR